MSKTAVQPEQPDQGDGRLVGWVATGGVLGAFAASTCCIVPLVLVSLGVSGAWIGNLTALSSYQPVIIAASLGLLGYGFWLVYRRPINCGQAGDCAQSLPNTLVKPSLWFAAVLITIALFWKWIAPVVAPVLLGL